MHCTELPDAAKNQIRNALVTVESSDLHLLLETASRALSRTTNQLGVILSPRLRIGVLSQLTVIPIASKRYILTVAFNSGFVKTMVIEFETGIPHDRLECACRIINTKYFGKTLQELCESDDCMFRDVQDLDLGVIRILVPSIRRIIEQDDESKVFAEGQTNILLQPEFFNRDSVGAVIEVLEEKNLLMHLFETSQSDNGVVISIGGENPEDQFKSFSVIKTQYNVGTMVGSLGVIGPKRMPYPLLVSAVEYTARVLGELHTKD
jgi:heat-inducible transcriptional repressor